ncbi:MAG: N-acetyltransferase family protein [Aestuariivirga sp.]
MISYRPPSLADAEEAARVHVQCWQEAYAGIMDAGFLSTLSVEDRAAGWRETLANPEAFTLLAIDADRIVGFEWSGPSRAPQHADGEIYAIYVLASHQGRGAGRGLFQLAAANWRQRGGSRMLANVVTRNSRARGFYAAMGGKAVAETEFKMAGMVLREKVMVFDVKHGL